LYPPQRSFCARYGFLLNFLGGSETSRQTYRPERITCAVRDRMAGEAHSCPSVDEMAHAVMIAREGEPLPEIISASDRLPDWGDGRPAGVIAAQRRV